MEACVAYRLLGQRRASYMTVVLYDYDIMIYHNIYHCVTIAYSIQYSNMLDWIVA